MLLIFISSLPLIRNRQALMYEVVHLAAAHVLGIDRIQKGTHTRIHSCILLR